MNIDKVKLQQNGYLVNDVSFMPSEYSGWMRPLVDEWLLTNTPEPEYTESELLTKAKAHIKSLFLMKVNEVLVTNQYDSLATVKLWSDDATFGVEATAILNWYKACIFYNINLESTMTTIPTDAEYLAGLPVLSV